MNMNMNMNMNNNIIIRDNESDILYYYEDQDHLIYLADSLQIVKEQPTNNHDWQQEGF